MTPRGDHSLDRPGEGEGVRLGRRILQRKIPKGPKSVSGAYALNPALTPSRRNQSRGEPPAVVLGSRRSLDAPESPREVWGRRSVGTGLRPGLPPLGEF